jgi:hypothetical protein
MFKIALFDPVNTVDRFHRFLVLSLGDHRPSCLFADFNPKELTWIVRSKKKNDRSSTPNSE